MVFWHKSFNRPTSELAKLSYEFLGVDEKIDILEEIDACNGLGTLALRKQITCTKLNEKHEKVFHLDEMHVE